MDLALLLSSHIPTALLTLDPMAFSHLDPYSSEDQRWPIPDTVGNERPDHR